MPRATAELFLKLEKEPLLKSFVLIGCTALSLHLGHRTSEDPDFIATTQKLLRPTLQAFTAKLQSQGYAVTPNDSFESYQEFLNAGMDLGDYSQTMIVGGILPRAGTN